ncbi:MAG: cell division protein FtsK [Hyphomicrobiales bacterium]|nr:cell division protein FtsK [Hyphomicrobiales bacterium]
MRTTTYSAIHYIPEPIRDFMAKRCAELTGLALLAGCGSLALALLTWSVQDPSLNYATSGTTRNLLGSIGAVCADLVMQMFGLAAVVLLVPLACWGWRLVTARCLERPRLRIMLWLVGTFATAAVFSLLPVTDRWPLPTGLGGVVGDALLALPRKFGGRSSLPLLLAGAVCAAISLLAMSAASGFGISGAYQEDVEPDNEDFQHKSDRRNHGDDDDDASGEPGLGLISLGAVIHGLLSLKAAIARRIGTQNDDRRAEPEVERPRRSQLQDGSVSPRIEPTLGQPIERPTRKPAPVATVPDDDEDDDEPSDVPIASRVTAPAPAIKSGKRAIREAQPSLLPRTTYELPPLLLLTEAKKQAISKISEDALEQNARLLEGVLDDFGVKGEIINVRPGPVVTLYELEPAPGIKSSRVIGLADDIARSMSAISARVAVVQGRNAIGIELPNQRRETVYLRELLASEDFEKNKHRLAIALGKTIGGEPVIVDLARMPHLLVAGTTGSGKSVAINTMILSLLYRLKPEECRLIMVDPKMLELSVYDGIPHLLTPVVTDPKKAVVALKWAVREMEDRYKKMSKVGVRNIDGFNARVAEAAAKGQVISRTVQTGYDRETGEAIYEKEDMDLSPLPYIVVIVDEMADLMMVAGKDIEGAIQRLAQMARAAGIHLIMATQRPSVDVITGTIKANFPTRISFQVTSKIDSRTILGEQGAEQLLGQGDMLYMAGGGRISRVHGPFVSDDEVEKIVAHLKTQGQPEYLEAITADDDVVAEESEKASPGSMDAEESGDMYDRAVAIVLRDRKCSTSYIQRRLSVGYNKAASLVERMEREGVVGAANHAGKREILVGNGVDRGAFDPEPD